ncbi:ABC-type transport auxiliary lipoprotein family protein [Sphingobium phenoxybenzoativorans]|nr:ABC-type transport auxiliary lipoprotein family protein [Sphingobium phenoxybenzoativorans]
MRNTVILPARLLIAMLLPAAALTLPGCVSFGGKAPSMLLSLSAEQKVAPGTVRSGGSGVSVTVVEPEAPKKLDTVRIPVQVSPTSVAYIQKVQWVDTPRHLFRSLLSETISASGTTIVLDPGQYSADPGRRLLGELVDFGVDAQSRMAIVTYDATLAAPDGRSISKKRFSASVPVSNIEGGSVGGPLNQAANKVAAEVAAWVTAGLNG